MVQRRFSQPSSVPTPPTPELPWAKLLRQRWSWIGLGAIALLFFLDFGSWLLAETIWFQELGYSQVFWLRMQTRFWVWLLTIGLSGGFVAWNLRLAWKLRNDDPPLDGLTPGSGLAIHRPRWRWQRSTGPFPATADGKIRVAMGLRLLLLTLGTLGLLLSMLLYHYGCELVRIWGMGSQLLMEAPDLPVQFNLGSLWEDVYELSALPWKWIPVGAIALSIVIAPWSTLITSGTLLCLSLSFILASHWTHLLPLLNPTRFGVQDPQFHRDISFYIFVLPAWELLRFWLVSILLFLLIAITVVYLCGTGSLSRGLFRGFSSNQQHHLYGLGGGLMLTIALSHWLSRYGRLYSQRGATFGASYTDVNIQLPVDVALTVIALLIAIILLYRAAGWSLHTPQKKLRLQRHRKANPLQFFILHPFLDLWIGYIVLVIFIGNVLPTAIQELLVLPNEFVREQRYITRGIDATRAAFDLSNIEVQNFDPIGTLTAADLLTNQATLDNIRLWDTRPLLQTNRQLQQIRLYYSFPDADIDRYHLDPGNPTSSNQQVIIAARELDFGAVPEEAQTWVNQHLVYTHGYGFTLSPVNTAGEGGLPTYFVKDIGTNITVQGNAELGLTNGDVRASLPVNAPRIYYGGLTNTYIMTSTRTRELDYPSGNDNIETVYDGQGGIAIGSLWRRWMFGMYLHDWQMWLTRNFTPNTKLLFRRNIQSRIQAIAPFLRFDADPYLVTATKPLVVQNGQLVETANSSSTTNYLYWVVDAYTTSDRYPYSDPGQQPFNYIRNSVKVVIDAYNGSTYFYITDPKDPIIQTWSRIFPDLFHALDDLPAPLRSHIRYPIDLFDIQSERLLTYHMTDPKVFYNREDQWQVPSEIYGNEPRPIEPYYLIMRLPTAEQEEFVLLHPFTPVRRNNLIAWLAGRSDGDNYGKLLLYQFPKQRLIFGPEQIEARINQEPRISQLISLWDREGSRVIQGNLLVIPIEQSLLYVEPLYLEAERNSLPTLIRVIVAYGNQIVMEENLQTALRVLFQGEQPSQQGIVNRTAAPPATTPATTPTTTPPSPANPLATPLSTPSPITPPL